MNNQDFIKNTQAELDAMNYEIKQIKGTGSDEGSEVCGARLKEIEERVRHMQDEIELLKKNLQEDDSQLQEEILTEFKNIQANISSMVAPE